LVYSDGDFDLLVEFWKKKWGRLIVPDIRTISKLLKNIINKSKRFDLSTT